MPAPERMLTYLRQAIMLVRATPGRRGHLIDLVDATDVLVSGDLHGHVGNFQTLLKTADLANNPGRHFVLQEVIHGNYRYPAGGDKSHQLIDLFAALKCQFPKRVHYLPGNHEMAQWTARKVLKADEDLNALFEDGVRAAYGPKFGPEVYQTYLELFKALPVVIRAPNRVLICHSLPTARTLPMFDPIRQNPQRKGFCKRDGLVTGLPVNQDSRQVGNFGYDLPILFLFNFNGKIHFNIPYSDMHFLPDYNHT